MHLPLLTLYLNRLPEEDHCAWPVVSHNARQHHHDTCRAAGSADTRAQRAGSNGPHGPVQRAPCACGECHLGHMGSTVLPVHSSNTNAVLHITDVLQSHKVCHAEVQTTGWKTCTDALAACCCSCCCCACLHLSNGPPGYGWCHVNRTYTH